MKAALFILVICLKNGFDFVQPKTKLPTATATATDSTHPLTQKLQKLLLVILSDRNLMISDLNNIFGDRIDMIQGYNKGAMYSHEFFRRE